LIKHLEDAFLRYKASPATSQSGGKPTTSHSEPRATTTTTTPPN
jgi:hypothetical protein